MAWVKPTNGFLKLNVKGVFNQQRMRAAVGCILRDGNGAWIKGSARMIGLAAPMAAELWALFYGLKMAWERNAEKKLILESDSAEAVDAVINPDPNFPLADLVTWINNLLREAWTVLEFVLVDESANEAAKALADLNVDGEGGVDDLDEAPAAIRTILLNES